MMISGHMSNRRQKRKSPKVPFPRKQWQPGQAPHVEKPKKGGGYDRRVEREDQRREARET
jgi:hypothetical protein